MQAAAVGALLQALASASVDSESSHRLRPGVVGTLEWAADVVAGRSDDGPDLNLEQKDAVVRFFVSSLKIDTKRLHVAVTS